MPNHRSSALRVPEADASVDPADFRRVMGHFATGVVAVTARDPLGGEPVGLAANSFTSVSLSPALVSLCVAHTSTTWPRIRRGGRFCVNVLAERQRAACAQLARSGGDKFRGLDWTVTPGGLPVLTGALARLECSVRAEHPAGDHVIVVAQVHAMEAGPVGDDGPLLFYRGGYGGFRG
ncbi:flavin reductase family protein [Streptomyces scopuliridis]|uniref:flavin reductase family protein n=1 Tax=Streptomyces scopuliridis TaxID=452529 RepID=UPI00369D268C